MADSRPAAIQDAAFVAPVERVRPHTKLIALLALGHLVVDVNQGALPAALPFLRDAHGLSYVQAATILFVANLTSSLIQPVFGYLSDRSARRWLLPASVLVSGIGVGLTGIVPGYVSVLALVTVMGLGVAGWHPEGFKTATGVAGDRKATGLSWFALGGNIGIALGPPFVTVLITGLGVAGTIGMLGPTVVVTAVLLFVLPALTRRAAGPAVADASRGIDMPWAMALLIFMVTIRSWVSLGFTTFVPFYYKDYLQLDPRFGGIALFVFLGGGALGTVVAGPLADRVGIRQFMRWVLLGAVPFGYLFLRTEGVTSFAMLAIFGAVLTSSFTMSIVLGQAYLPRNAGMASGLIVGLAIGMGGVGVTALGWVADHHGVPAALTIASLLPVAGFIAGRFLPLPRERATTA